MNDTETLLEQWSPLCNMQAFVEANDSTVYFYLWVYPGTEMAEIRSCWVCNRRPAMEEMDYAAMDSGEAPRMPLEYVDHDPGGIELDRDRLSIVWFEEGDAAFLFEGGRMLQAIPGWAGREVPGVLSVCQGVGPFAWELKTALPALSLRATAAALTGRLWRGIISRASGGTAGGAGRPISGPTGSISPLTADSSRPGRWSPGRRAGTRYAFTLGNGALSQPKIEQYFQEDSWKYPPVRAGDRVSARHGRGQGAGHAQLRGSPGGPSLAGDRMAGARAHDSLRGCAGLRRRAAAESRPVPGGPRTVLPGFYGGAGEPAVGHAADGRGV